MSSLGGNPLIHQGLLNRVLAHVIVTNNQALNISAPYMAKSQAVLSFDGPFTNQIGTATGIVDSPEPYVLGQIVVGILRTQPLSGAWILQAQTASVIGEVAAYPDVSAAAGFPKVTLANCSIIDYDPGAFDGMDPTVKITIKGLYYINAQLWTGVLVSA